MSEPPHFPLVSAGSLHYPPIITGLLLLPPGTQDASHIPNASQQPLASAIQHPIINLQQLPNAITTGTHQPPTNTMPHANETQQQCAYSIAQQEDNTMQHNNLPTN